MKSVFSLLLILFRQITTMVSYETRLITLTIHCNLQLNKPLLSYMGWKTSSLDESFPFHTAIFEFTICSVASGYHFGHEYMYRVRVHTKN
jgi:hypothetical protein